MASLLPSTLPFTLGVSGGSTPTIDDLSFKVEVAWDDTPASAAPTYTDMTSEVLAAAGVSFQRGRSNELDAQAQPGRASFQFQNPDGDLTVGNTSSPYAPLRIRRPCRISAVLDTTTYRLWQGFVDSWENSTDDRIPVAAATASDRLARCSTIRLPGFVEGEILSDAPSAYYPMTDSEGATAAGDQSPHANPPLVSTQVGTGGTVDFGVGVSPGPDGGPVAAFTPLSSGNYRKLVGSSPLRFGGVDPAEYTIEAFIKTTSTASMTIVQLGTSWALLSLLAAGGEVAGEAINDGEWHHVAATRSDATLTGSVFVDGVEVFSGSYAFEMGPQSDIEVGANFDGQIAHVAVFGSVLSDARILEHAQAGLTSLVGETSDLRFDRLCRHAGLPTAHYTSPGTGLSTMAAQATRGVSLLEALRQVAEAEGGVAYIDGAGVLTFQPRSTRYGATTGLTLDAGLAGQVGVDFAHTIDDSLLVNDVTVERPNGATQRRVDEASVEAYGTHADSVTLYVDTDTQAAAAAEWRLYANSTPEPRAATLTVNLAGYAASGGNLAALLGVDVGTLVTVTGLPTEVAPTGEVSLFIEGINGRIGPNGLELSFNTAPAGPAGSVFIFNDPVYGVFDGPGRFAF